MFWKKKTPAEILGNIVIKLENMADHQKLSFLQNNMHVIRTQMEKDPLPVQRLRGAFLTETMEKGLGYLFWHSEILDVLHDEDDGYDPVDADKLSPAAVRFIEETKHDLIAFFHKVFAINPPLALQKFGPAELFEKTILDAMASLSVDKDCRLYFSSYDQIQIAGCAESASLLQQRLMDSTVAALENILARDPQALLFPHSTGSQKIYLDYLPDGILRENFLLKNAAVIDAAFDEAPNKGSEEYIKDKKIILAERVKICFHAAAMGDTTCLNEQIAALEGNASDHMFIYSHYVGLPYLPEDRPRRAPINPDPFTPLFELIRLENPSAPADAEDENCGARSKYLWMIKRDQMILASVFSKAAMADYLREQNELGTITCPTVQDWDSFLIKGRTHVRQDLDLVFPA